MKAAFITTVRHNVGDDWVRDGILHLLRRAVGPVEPWLIHKHFPASVRREWAWLHDSGGTRALDRIPWLDAARCSRVIERLPLWPARDRILGADLVVQCGAPVYWLHPGADCTQNEWYGPLIRRRWRRVRASVPLLNIGAGSCQAYGSDGSEFSAAPDVLAYIRTLHAECALTTVRDRLSATILRLAGVTAPLLPCPSLFARQLHGVAPAGREYIALNFMADGGHYRFSPDLNPARWQEVFVAFARRLAQREPCLLVCHDQDEFTLAARLLPQIPRFFDRDHRAYLGVYSRAKAAVVNRVHAAFALASFGRPAVVVGNDSRARMVEMLDETSLNAADVTVDQIEIELARRMADAGRFEVAMAALIPRTENEYLRLLAGVLHRGT